MRNVIQKSTGAINSTQIDVDLDGIGADTTLDPFVFELDDFRVEMLD